MRTVVVAVLGIFSGLLLSFVLIDVGMSTTTQQGRESADSVWRPVAGFGPFLMAAAGAAVAIAIDRRRVGPPQTRRSETFATAGTEAVEKGKSTMQTRKDSTDTGLPWGLIIALALVGLVRPLMSTFGILDALGKPWSPIVVTVLIAIVWVALAVARRVAQPVPALSLAGIGYGVLAVLLSFIGSTVTDEPSMSANGVVYTIIYNALFGLVLGLIAMGLLRVRGRARH